MNHENEQLEKELSLLADRLDTLAESLASRDQREILQEASQRLHEVCGLLCSQPLLRDAAEPEQPCDACETTHVPCATCPCVQIPREVTTEPSTPGKSDALIETLIADRDDLSADRDRWRALYESLYAIVSAYDARGDVYVPDTLRAELAKKPKGE